MQRQPIIQPGPLNVCVRAPLARLHPHLDWAPISSDLVLILVSPSRVQHGVPICEDSPADRLYVPLSAEPVRPRPPSPLPPPFLLVVYYPFTPLYVYLFFCARVSFLIMLP